MIEKIKNKLREIFKSDYLKNVATLSAGTTFAQLISIGTAPVLYRIYDKVDYGTLGLYMAITGVIGVFSTMQYLQPILLEKEDDDAKKIMWLNRIINTVITSLVLLLVFLFGELVGRLFNNEAITPWLYLVPISIFFSGQNEIFRVWANRKKKYKIMSFNAILTALLVPAVSITTGLLYIGPLGLFLGLLTSQVIPPIVLLIALTKNEDLGLKYFSWNEIKIKAKAYSDFPLYSLPSEFISRFINQLPVFMLSTYAGPAVVGVYNLSVRMLGLPVQLVGGAISEVFKQKAIQDYKEIGNFNNIFIKTFKTLGIISLIPIIVILLYGPELFAFVFGLEWIESGVLAQILITVFMLKLIISPLSYSYVINNKLKEDLFWHIYILCSMGLIFLIGFKVTDDYKQILIVYTVNYSLIYFLYLSRSYLFSKSKNNEYNFN
jgi:O-antigen/teichoic acid export membrane protein